MPLSISSSNERLPAGPWWRTWLLAAGLAVGVLASYEAALRAHGFTPAVSDDARLWALARGHIHPEDPDEVVVIGSSRARSALDPATLAEVFGRPPVLLAVNASGCVPVLRDLAEDDTFRGLVLCEVTPAYFFNGVAAANAGTQADFVRRYRAQPAEAPLEERLQILVQESLAFRLSRPGPQEVVLSLLESGRWPEPPHTRTFADRSTFADYSKADLAKLNRLREQEARDAGGGAPPGPLGRDLAAIALMVRRIQARGGRVVFLFLPTGARVREIEGHNFPRPMYWDALVAETGAPAIHWRDYPELAGFDTPDGSHLDPRQAAEFTGRLLSILRPLLGKAL